LSAPVMPPLPHATLPSETRPGVPAARQAALPPESPVRAQNGTAIYDIKAGRVYLPNGEILEAHSGLGQYEDDPRSAALRNRGVTPHGTYDLSLRRGLYHGVQALALTPEDPSAMHGRDGILAHTYMSGPSGQSHGCVVFRNYARVLNAYLQGDIKRIQVV
jgi:hypothetical protein